MTESATMPVSEFARVLGISRTAAYRHIEKERIPVIRLGRRVLVPRTAVEQLLSSAGPVQQKVAND